jgi:hypothetical protein
MTDGGAPFQPSADGMTVSLRPRGAYAGYRAFGSGDGAVLIASSVVHDLRSAAERATAEGRVTGGLLYGCGWADEAGTYLVIDHYLEASPGEDSFGEDSPGEDSFGEDSFGEDSADASAGDFALSEADLRLLREDGASVYSAFLEAGWWRTRTALGEFGPRDLVTQGELVGPDGVGLLVYGSGIYWGTAYLGPDGHAPDSAGTLAAVPGPVPGSPEPGPAGAVAPEPELVDIAAGESLEQVSPPGTAPPRRVRRRVVPSVPRRTRRRGTRLPAGDDTGPAAELPADAQLVVGALMVVIIAAAIIIGFLASSLLVAVIIGAVGLLVVVGAVWMSHRY